MSYHRGGQTGSVAVSYSTSPMAPHSPSRGYSSGSTSSSTTTSGVGGGGGGGGGGSTGTGSTTSTYNYTSRGTSLLRDRSSIFPTSTSLTIPSLRSSYVSDCKRSYCQTGRSVSTSSSSSYSSDKKGIGGGFSSKLSNGISSGGTGSRYASSTSSSHLSSSTGSRDRILDTSPGSSSTLRRDVNTDHLIGRCSASTYVPNIRHSTGSHQRWKPQHSKAGSSSLNELIGGEEREGERPIRPDSSLSSSSSSSSAITGGGLWSRSKERPPTGSTVLTTATGHARAHSATSSVEQQQQHQQQQQQQQQQEPQVLLQLNEFEIDENEVIHGVGDVAPNEPVDTDREILEDLPNESPSANSFDIEDNDFVFGTLYPVLQNGLPGRTSDGHSDDPSLPSTSRRQDGHFSGVAGAVNTVSAGRSSPTAASTGYQSLYRAGIEFEGSPTNRPARSPYQPHRDERCGLNGLRNIGNTCFMNSVIQCLSNTRPLLEYVMNEQYLIDINTKTSSMKGALIKEFSQVIHELWQVDGDHVVNTTTLKTQIQRFTPRFLGYSQQDAQEFLRYLLEGLHEDVNRVVTKPQPIHTDIPDVYSDSEKAAESWKRYLRSEDSMIVDIFVGQLRSSLRCTHCNHVSVTLDPFWDLSLPIPARSGTVKLSQCLEHFTREEVLDGDEKPTCSKCQMRRKCTKSFSIQKFPKILVIHLKRFSPMERYRGKLNVVVDFPLMDLDLSAFAAPRVPGCTYNLYGVANHSGTTYSGHYTAYCKHPYSGEWHEYNDSHVSAIPARSVVSSEAYVLFYEQQPHSSHL